jgi:hypothetical protein
MNEVEVVNYRNSRQDMSPLVVSPETKRLLRNILDVELSEDLTFLSFSCELLNSLDVTLFNMTLKVTTQVVLIDV